jgi:glycosyltransferase involved in cell wall biosynthesis
MTDHSAGRPTIGARIGGIVELVREGETGWLFEPGSADDLERVVGKAPAQPDVLAGIAALARRTFIERYAPAIHLERLLAIYEKAITARPMAAAKVPGKEQKQF